MSRVRTLTLAASLLVCCGGVQGQANKSALNWSWYTADGKKYTHPRWAANADGTVRLVSSEAVLTAGDFTATAVKMRLEVPGPGGGWVLLFEDEAAKVGAKDARRKTHTLTGIDPGPNKTSVPAGGDVRIIWTVELKDVRGVAFEVRFGPFEMKAQNTPLDGKR